MLKIVSISICTLLMASCATTPAPLMPLQTTADFSSKITISSHGWQQRFANIVEGQFVFSTRTACPMLLIEGTAYANDIAVGKLGLYKLNVQAEQKTLTPMTLLLDVKIKVTSVVLNKATCPGNLDGQLK